MWGTLKSRDQALDPSGPLRPVLDPGPTKKGLDPTNKVWIRPNTTEIGSATLV
jgi:hypothetical protein